MADLDQRLRSANTDRWSICTRSRQEVAARQGVRRQDLTSAAAAAVSSLR
ncbi:pollen-specific leucine-rich repeat extensin-like protein 4 [Iris pallida]|uniref:Pollen-specific leucine-rich repeat extensin-like protein 4 n=1 Tax=Iris pallida TaxID=29817 RepID=A0AAX6DN00_IRIPA|nr:pollen-specific leucine-rich repeat extensin-like protein 4 [Iris pallida]